VVLTAEPGHLRSRGVTGQGGGLAVEGVDFLADGEVLICDGAFTVVFVLVGLTVLLVLLGIEQASTGLTKTAGYVLLAAAAGGVYLFFNSLSLATGGKALPLGRPILCG
jgi:hypothetical protein